MRCISGYYGLLKADYAHIYALVMHQSRHKPHIPIRAPQYGTSARKTLLKQRRPALHSTLWLILRWLFTQKYASVVS
jgi:hypothetical protein